MAAQWAKPEELAAIKSAKKKALKRFRLSFTGCLVPSSEPPLGRNGLATSQMSSGSDAGSPAANNLKLDLNVLPKSVNETTGSPSPRLVSEMVSRYQNLSMKEKPDKTSKESNRSEKDESQSGDRKPKPEVTSSSQVEDFNELLKSMCESGVSDPTSMLRVKNLDAIKLEEYISSCEDTSESLEGNGDKFDVGVALRRDVSKSLTVQTASGRIVTIRDLLSSIPPEKESRREKKNCTSCEAKFSLFFPNVEHCRFCRLLFCTKCLPFQSVLPPKFKKNGPRKVCQACSVKLQPLREYYGRP